MATTVQLARTPRGTFAFVPKPQLHTRVWASEGSRLTFPEMEPGVLPPKRNSAICFSGGGMVSLAATVGQLRGLAHLGLLGEVRYMSAVSGGARAAITYAYYRRGPANDEELLGPITPPAVLDFVRLRRLERGNLGFLATRDPTATMIRLVSKHVPSEQLWNRAAGLEYLEPYGLYDATEPACFSLDERTVDEVKSRNSALATSPFYIVRSSPPRPYLVVQASFLVPTALSPYKRARPVACEFTPLYVGDPFATNVNYESETGEKETVLVGGGYVEPFAFGSAAPSAPVEEGTVGVEPPPQRFTLADVSGATTASFAVARNNYWGSLSPQWLYWPVTPDGNVPTTRFNFGDGGAVERYGLISMLRRGVENLVVFINTGTRLRIDYDPSGPPGADDIEPNLPSLFGVPNSFSPYNRVFDSTEFAPLVRALQSARRAGKTVVARTELVTVHNEWWGLEGGHHVQILWVYNERVPDWERHIRKQTGIPTAIDAGNERLASGPFRRFPNYLVYGQNTPGSVALTREQINLLADLSCWNVTSNAKTFSAGLGAD